MQVLYLSLLDSEVVMAVDMRLTFGGKDPGPVVGRGLKERCFPTYTILHVEEQCFSRY